MTNTITATTAATYLVTFTRCRFNAEGTGLIPLTVTEGATSTWTVPESIATKLLAASESDEIDRCRVQSELLADPAAGTPVTQVGFAYDHPFTLRVERVYSKTTVMKVVNTVVDTIDKAADLDEEGTIDALNLLTNAVGYSLDRDGAAVELADVVASNYEPSDEGQPMALSTVLGWIR